MKRLRIADCRLRNGPAMLFVVPLVLGLLAAPLAAQHRLPDTYPWRDFARAGGLMSYDANRPVLYRRLGFYVDRILKGAMPGDLPVEQPTKYDLLINLKTAKALGLTIPQSLLMRADQVIE